ncbi:MAG: phosphotransferase [Chloroflexota bacterium]
MRRLLAAQFPAWAALPLTRVEPGGTDNVIFRLGDEMSVRLPRRPSAAREDKFNKERDWLPRLAPRLPLAVPEALAAGEPGEGYPCRWAVHRWVAGEPAERDRIGDPHRAARDLAAFVVAMRGVDATGGPTPGAHNSFRGVPLRQRDRAMREAIAASTGLVEIEAVTAAWEAALRAPEWTGPPRWLHGDLLPGNVLAQDGRITGVIDFGCLGTGDPACDLLPAWTILPPEARHTFRAAVEVDDDTWTRGRGWALSWAMIALPYYIDSLPAFAAMARRTVDEVLADAG